MKNLALLLFTLFFLAGCGGGGSDDNDDSDNGGSGGGSTALDSEVEQVSEAAVATSKRAISTDSNNVPLPVAGVVETNSIPDYLQALLDDHLASIDSQGAAGLPVAAEINQTFDQPGDCGGNMSADIIINTDDANIYPISTLMDGTLTNFCVEDSGFQTTINGTFDYEISQPDAENLTYTVSWNMTYTTNAPDQPSSGEYVYSETCTVTSGEPSCTVSSNYMSEGGEEYSLEEADVSGDASSGYDISATLRDEDGNSYTVSFTGLTQCENGNIGSGSGSVVYNGDEIIQINFNSCDEYTVTYQGVSETYPQ